MMAETAVEGSVNVVRTPSLEREEADGYTNLALQTQEEKEIEREAVIRDEAVMYEEAQFKRHELIVSRFKYGVTSSEKGMAGSRYRINLELMDQFNNGVSWVVRRPYSAFKTTFDGLKDIYSEVKDFSSKFPPKAFFHTKAVQEQREIAFSEFTTILLNIYPWHPSVFTFLGMDEEKVKLAIDTFPVPQKPKPPKKTTRVVSGPGQGQGQGIENEGKGGDDEEEEKEKEGDCRCAEEIDIENSNLSEEEKELLLAKFHNTKKTKQMIVEAAIILSIVPLSMFVTLLRENTMEELFYCIPGLFFYYWERSQLFLTFLSSIFMIWFALHRLIGWGVGMWLTDLLGKEYGPYHFSCEWISIRWGLDCNELIISGLTWHNPLVFTKTPYFARIETIKLAFEPLSIYNSIKDGGKSLIDIHRLEISGVKAYIEKIGPEIAVFAHSSDMNLWACLGAEEGDASKNEMKSGIMSSMAKAIASTSKSGMNVVGSVADKLMKNNPVAFLYKHATKKSKKGRKGKGKLKDDGEFHSDSDSGSDSGDSDSDNDEQTGETPSPESISNQTTVLNSPSGFEDGEGGYLRTDLDSPKEDVNQGRSISAETPPRKTGWFSRSPKTPVAPASGGSSSASLPLVDPLEVTKEEGKAPSSPSKIFASHKFFDLGLGLGGAGEVKKPMLTPEEIVKKKQEEDAAFSSLHWGVIYPLRVRHLLVLNVRAYAADFICAEPENCPYEKKQSLYIKTIDMHEKELKNTSKGSKTTGLYLDELTWRLISSIINEILANNKKRLAKMAGSAALTNTTAAITDGIDSAASTLVEGLHNYNPFQIFRKTYTAIGRGMAGAPNIKQDESMIKMKLKTLRIHIISIQQGRRFDDKKIKNATISLALTGQDGNIQEETNTRMSNPYFTIAFDEHFEIGPVVSFASKLLVKMIYKTITGPDLVFCHTTIHLTDRDVVGLREWKDFTIPFTPGDLNGLNEDSKYNANGNLHARIMLC